MSRLTFSCIALKKPTLPTFAHILILCCSLGLLSGCSIDDRTSQEIRINHKSISNFIPTSELDFFEARCLRCIRGDISDLKNLSTIYSSSFPRYRNKIPKDQRVEPFLYQQIRSTKSFERCAQKARLLGDRTGIKHMLVQPGPIIRSARYFYAKKDYTTGSFWLQRLVNLKGERAAYEAAGRNFVRHTNTISIGVQLLEQSARLGSKDARLVLMGLMAPGSIYYQQITTKQENENDDRSKNKIDNKETYQRPSFKPTEYAHVPFNLTSPVTPEMSKNIDDIILQHQQSHQERLQQVKERALQAAQEAEARLKE